MPLKVTCIGAGYFSHFHRDAWQRITGADLCAVCDLDEGLAKATGILAYNDLQPMLKECQPDILDIITPPSTHAQTVSAAIAHGVKVIICQKPFCVDMEQAGKTAKEASEAGVTLVVHENFRFQPWFRLIKRYLSEGKLGKVQQAQFRLRTGDGQGPEAYLDRQPYFQRMPKLLVHETAVHYIDTFRYLFGEASAVYADLSRRNPVIAGEDAGFIILDYPNQVSAVFDGNRHLDFAAENTRLTFGELLVEGTEASMQLHGNGRVSYRRFGEQRDETVLAARQWPGFAGDCVYAFQQHVVDHLLSDQPLENTAQEYVGVLRLEELIYESADRACKLKTGC